MQEKENVLRILRETIKSFKKKDANNLKNLSNQTIHTATTSQDFDNILIAVLVYSLGKVLERENYQQINGWNFFYKETINNLKQTLFFLEKEDIDSFRIYLGKIRESVNEIDSNLSTYIKDIFYKSQINKASKIYQHGISAQRAAELLGISLWDLASYIGQGIVNEAEVRDSLPFNEREKILEDFLK